MTRVRSVAVSLVFQRLYRLVLIVYVFAVACGSREFSRLQVNVAGIPLFPGEGVADEEGVHPGSGPLLEAADRLVEQGASAYMNDLSAAGAAQALAEQPDCSTAGP